MPTNIAIFASGSGSNALKIMEHFEKKPEVASVRLLVASRASIGALIHAEAHGVAHEVVTGRTLRENPEVLGELLDRHEIGFIALAGFLAMVPPAVTRRFAGRILNIHPSLLPAYGGKGMYGGRVHEAVLADGCSESGMTIHQVNEVYDDGEIVHQSRVDIAADETPESLQQKILKLEHHWYPRVIEAEITKLNL